MKKLSAFMKIREFGPARVAAIAAICAGIWFAPPAEGRDLRARGWLKKAGCAAGTVKAAETTNLLLRSQELDNAAWTKQGDVVTAGMANTAVAPDGTTTADSYSIGATIVSTGVFQTKAVTAGASYTASVYLKYVNSAWYRFLWYDGSNQLRVWVNAQTCAIGTKGGTGTAVFSASGTQDVGSGWCRVWFTGTLPGASTYFQLNAMTGDNSLGAQANSTVYVWGAQLEATQTGSPQPYVPTTATPVTRPGGCYETFAGYELPDDPFTLAQVNMLPTFGQSLAMGNAAVPPITTTQPYDALMFDSSVRTYAATYAALSPLVETAGTGSPRFAGLSLGETPAAGTAIAFEQLLVDEGGGSGQFLFSVDGDGVTMSTFIDSASQEYQRLRSSMRAGKTLSTAAGKTFNIPAFTLSHGESDYAENTTHDLYREGMETLRVMADAEARAASGQTNAVRLVAYQLASHKFYSRAYPSIALAQLAASKKYPKIFIATPMYHLAYSDGVHITNEGEKILGFYYGLVLKRVLVDKVAWKPLMPLSTARGGNTVTVTFHVPSGQLALDTTLVAANTNYGFNLFDGASEMTISSVELSGTDKVVITASAPIPAGAVLRYAFYGAGADATAQASGKTTGARGNLRDTQGESIVFDPTGLNYPAHNWCVIFEETIP